MGVWGASTTRGMAEWMAKLSNRVIGIYCNSTNGKENGCDQEQRQWRDITKEEMGTVLSYL